MTDSKQCLHFINDLVYLVKPKIVYKNMFESIKQKIVENNQVSLKNVGETKGYFIDLYIETRFFRNSSDNLDY